MSYLYIYWVHNTGIMYPTLQMAKTCLKRRLFDDKNDLVAAGWAFTGLKLRNLFGRTEGQLDVQGTKLGCAEGGL